MKRLMGLMAALLAVVGLLTDFDYVQQVWADIPAWLNTAITVFAGTFLAALGRAKDGAS